jgi:peptidyl-prolyl cis-trans isomerase A (cyclophilin A)
MHRTKSFFRFAWTLAALGVAGMTGGCGGGATSTQSATTPAPTPAATAAQTPAPSPEPTASPAATAEPVSADATEGGAAEGAWPDKAPDTFKVRFELSNGTVVAEFQRAWSPIGVQHFYDLVRKGFYNEAKFFRVVPGFVVQFGIAADPEMDRQWANQEIRDDAVKQSNVRGTITFAKSGAPNSRSTQLFINLGNNARLDAMAFSPIGRVIEGMEIVDAIESKHGERPDQGAIHAQGNAYLDQRFPGLDFIVKAALEK